MMNVVNLLVVGSIALGLPLLISMLLSQGVPSLLSDW